MTQNRRKRGFNDGTEDRSVAPYFQWKLKYGAIALRAQRAKRKPASLGFPFEYSHLSRSALPRLVDARGVRRARPKEFFHRTCRWKNVLNHFVLCTNSARLILGVEDGVLDVPFSNNNPRRIAPGISLF